MCGLHCALHTSINTTAHKQEVWINTVCWCIHTHTRTASSVIHQAGAPAAATTMKLYNWQRGRNWESASVCQRSWDSASRLWWSWRSDSWWPTCRRALSWPLAPGCSLVTAAQDVFEGSLSLEKAELWCNDRQWCLTFRGQTMRSSSPHLAPIWSRFLLLCCPFCLQRFQVIKPCLCTLFVRWKVRVPRSGSICRFNIDSAEERWRIKS